MATLIAAQEAAARVRAAIGYAGLEHADLAPTTGIHVSTLRRITSKTAPRGASIEELWQIADACGVPRAFMEEGFATEPADLRQELEAQAARLDRIERLLRRTGADLPPALTRLSELLGAAEDQAGKTPAPGEAVDPPPHAPDKPATTPAHAPKKRRTG